MSNGFKVGDIVITENAGGNIGKVIKITQKRKDVVVEFNNGTYKETYDARGFQKGYNVLHRGYIRPYTEELRKERQSLFIKRKARRLMDENRYTLTLEQAVKIIDAFEQKDKE